MTIMMDQICKRELCTGCGMCTLVCPKQCIILQQNSEGFLYPEIHVEQCIDCKKCKRMCPANHAIDTVPYKKVYAAWSKNSKTKQNSSSGGIFFELAQYVLKQSGFVCGAVLDMPQLELYHLVSDQIKDIERMRGSKYFQSNSVNAYKTIKEKLLAGCLVLYSGTGCQVAGLLQYLDGVDLTNLITIDVLCHGVTSRKVVQKYLQTFPKNDMLVDLIFRNKDLGYGGVCIKRTYADGTCEYGKSREDLFMLAFNHNLCLRNSCYHCAYAGPERIADITIADFWGLGEIKPFPEKQNGGTSLLLTNTQKGEHIVEQIKNCLYLYERTYQEARRKNRCLVKPSKYNKNRVHFFSLLDQENFESLVRRFVPQNTTLIKLKSFSQILMLKLRRKFARLWYRE